MKYVVLLRGINVGGKNKVSMSALKEQLLKIGFEDVSSYINSGNLFFTSLENHERCIAKIKNLLETNYYFSIPFPNSLGPDFSLELLLLAHFKFCQIFFFLIKFFFLSFFIRMDFNCYYWKLKFLKILYSVQSVSY